MKGLLAIFIAALLWSSAGTVAKVLVVGVSPFTVILYRFGFASLVLLPLFLRVKKPKRYLRNLLPLGIFNSLNVIFYYSGAKLTTANTMVILGTAVPITATVLSYFLIKERITKQKIAGILIGLIGVLYIALLPILSKGQTNLGSLPGNTLEVASLISWSLYIVYSKHILTEHEFSPILSTSINLFTCTISALLLTLVTGQSLFLPAMLHPAYGATMAYAAIGLTVITFFLFQWGVRYVTASTASLKEYIQLIGGIAVNGLILGEPFSTSYFIGTAFVVAGVIVASGAHLTKKLAGIQFGQGD